MSYNRVPEGFLNGLFISPHTFSDPQNPQHGQFVNLQLRNDLYFSAAHQISNIEFGLMPMGEQEWVQVQKFSECKGQLPWFAEYARSYKKKKGKTLQANENRKVELLGCQQWSVVYYRGKKQQRSVYRVNTLQSDTDIFKSQIYPPSFYKTLKDLFVN